MTEPRDRILDLALQEELAGETPPDLSDRIRWQLAQDQHRQGQIALLRRHPQKARRMWAGGVLGAAAALAVIFLVQTMQDASPKAALSLTVVTGSLRWHSPGASTELLRSDSSRSNIYTVFPVLGDRLHASTEESIVLKLAGLGTLEMSPACVLEVEEMEFSEFGKGFVVGAIVVAVVAGTAQFFSGDYAVQAEAGESLDLRQGDQLVAVGAPVSTERMQQELADLLAENQRLRETVARRRVETPAEAATEMEAELEIGVAVTYADLAESLQGMDWTQMGLATRDMIPKIQELMKAIEAGEEPSLDLQGQIQQLNGQILENLGKLKDGQIPGTGPNGVFTHPVFAANLMNATLEAAGVGLDQGQLRNLQDLTTRFAGEDDSRRGSYGSDVPMIQQLMEEIDLRDRFFAQAKASMSPEQLAAIGNGPNGPGPMDLFSGDIAWQQFTKPVKVESRAAFASKLTGNLLRGLKLDATQDAAQISKLTQMVARWAEAAPDSHLGSTPRGLVNAKAFPSAGVTAAARYQAQLFRNMISNLGLSSSQNQILLKNRGVFIPIYTGK